MPQLPDNYDNLWATILIVAIIVALVFTGYWRSRPKKKPDQSTLSYMRDAQGNEYIGQRAASQTLNVSALGRAGGTKPLRSMHRRDDPDYPVGMDSLGVFPIATPANDGHNPAHSGPHISGFGGSDYSSGGFGSSDSGSSSSSSDGGSSGGGDGGGGGGGD